MLLSNKTSRQRTLDRKRLLPAGRALVIKGSPPGRVYRNREPPEQRRSRLRRVLRASPPDRRNALTGW
jgi:hypothetical protein